MKLTFRWKLTLSLLLPILLMGAILYIYLEKNLRDYLVRGIAKNLHIQANLARDLAFEEMDRKIAPSKAAITIHRELNARVTIIAPDGKVVGDSDISQSNLLNMENHLNRPEVQEALHSGSGEEIRYSTTLHSDMLYVAAALPFEGKKGVLRLALPLSEVRNTIVTLHSILAAAVVGGVIFAILLSSTLLHFTSRSLKTMASVAMHLGRGEFGRRIPAMGKDELGELANVMNEMAAKLENQVVNISTERNRLDAILRGMGEGLMVTDAEGTITLVNPAFKLLFGIADEVEGKPLIHITRLPALHSGFKGVLTTGSERIEEMTLPLPAEKTVIIHWVPLMESGSLYGVVAVFHDISDIKKLEKMRRDFVANVSHELKTPVAVIKGYAETLLDGMLQADPLRAKAFLGIIYDHSERLANLITDLLTLSQMETGNLALEKTSVSVARAVEHACSLLDQRSRDKKVSLRWESDSTLSVSADPVKLEQVLVNLLDNAIKYTPEGGNVTVSARTEGDMIQINVADTGVGIPAKDLSRIFERFYRVDPARSRELGGTGLGLSIVKHIIQLHGGSVSVKSVPGKGSTFSFTLRKA